jgi:hypothetical protein
MLPLDFPRKLWFYCLCQGGIENGSRKQNGPKSEQTMVAGRTQTMVEMTPSQTPYP